MKLNKMRIQVSDWKKIRTERETEKGWPKPKWKKKRKEIEIEMWSMLYTVNVGVKLPILMTRHNWFAIESLRILTEHGIINTLGTIENEKLQWQHWVVRVKVQIERGKKCSRTQTEHQMRVRCVRVKRKNQTNILRAAAEMEWVDECAFFVPGCRWYSQIVWSSRGRWSIPIESIVTPNKRCFRFNQMPAVFFSVFFFNFVAAVAAVAACRTLPHQFSGRFLFHHSVFYFKLKISYLKMGNGSYSGNK